MRIQVRKLDPASFCSVTPPTAMVAGVGTTVPLMYLQTQITFVFDLLLYRLLVFVYLAHVVDSVGGLGQGASLGNVICLNAQDVCGDLFQRADVGLDTHLFHQISFYFVRERVRWQFSDQM